MSRINDAVESHAEVTTTQIIADIATLREVINKIRMANGIPCVISMTSPDNQLSRVRCKPLITPPTQS